MLSVHIFQILRIFGLSGNLYSWNGVTVENAFWTFHQVNSWAICILHQIACEVKLSLCCKSDWDMKNRGEIWGEPWSWEKRAGSIQSIIATIQFRMLHVLIYKIDIVTVILCGCGIWCLISGEEHRLSVYESRLVRRIFDVRGR